MKKTFDGTAAGAGTDGNANLWLQLWKSDDLDSWTNAGEAVLWQMPAGEGKQFYKVQAGE